MPITITKWAAILSLLAAGAFWSAAGQHQLALNVAACAAAALMGIQATARLWRQAPSFAR